MFVKIGSINYFVIADNKSVQDIFQEIFCRMNRSFISEKEKREILSAIRKQVRKNAA